MQELWPSGVGWDELLDKEHKDTWRRIAEQLQDTSNILLPRYYSTSMSDTPMRMHTFCDTSQKAYGAVIYICMENRQPRLE